MPAPPPPHRIETTALATARAVRRAFDVRLAGLDLNLSSASALSYINDGGPVTQSRLAELLHIGRASTGSLIDDLERKGLVERQADPSDRRTWRIGLTQAGRAKAHDFEELDRELRVEFRRGMNRSERQLLGELLVRLEQNALTVRARAVKGL